MRIDYQNARSLCTDAEFGLLQVTKPKSLTALSAAQLKQKAGIARKYADKWREQAKRGGNSTDGSADRSRQKHEFFREALTRIEARIARIEKPTAPVTKAAKKAAKKTAKKAAKKVAGKAAKKAAKSLSKGGKAGLSRSNKANQKAIASSQRIAASGLSSRIRGHVSARGRRNQAARASRQRS